MTPKLPPPRAANGPPAPIPHWFFTSYSEGRNRFPLVKRFHDDVEEEVRGILGKQEPGSGFLDFKSIKPGEFEENRLVENGVCTASAMLALYSPSFFGSPWCPVEWTVFATRVRRYRDSGGVIPCLIGLTWQRGRAQDEWPDVVTEFQYVRRAADTKYEQYGLIQIVPRRPQDPESWEYREIVLEVAGLIAEALKAAVPRITVEEAEKLRPLFGSQSALPVDFVLAYAKQDERWGEWALVHLKAHNHRVDVLPLAHVGHGQFDRLRRALRREGKVVVLVSRDALASGGMTKAVLDAAYADPAQASDLTRLVPIFIEEMPEENVPVGFRPFLGNALHGISDPDAVEEILVGVAEAPVRDLTALSEEEPAFPSTSVPASTRTLVDNLSLASSVADPVIRAVWLERIALTPSDHPRPEMPLRPWLFGVLAACMRKYGSYEALADALDDLELGSPEAIQVRRIIEGLRQAPEA
ncbi:TIR domain-containing protein [Streptomyces sp. NPDC056785]|uniref:TIR domain-containing protein n=1 Tax=Streptomyces sp. NPDC056785 TaxID=3345944 RepID=UPI0036A476FF